MIGIQEFEFVAELIR